MHATAARNLINIAAATLAGAFLLLGSAPSEAATKLVARVDISAQRMEVLVDGQAAFEWKVSTGRKGYETPTGSYTPTRMHEMWYSKTYDNAPMPHSVFFSGGYAVHATEAVKRLGNPASHAASVSRPRTRRISSRWCRPSARRTQAS